MNRAQHIQRTHDTLDWIDSRVNGVVLPADIRSRLAAACLHQALEHSRSIIVLIERQLTGSAFALVRSLFESFVRGAWLHQCATEQDIARYMDDKLEIMFAAMLAQLEQTDAYSAGSLSAVKQRSWPAMNSFTHTGFRQTVRRNTGTSVDANYPEEEVLQALGFATATAYMGAVEIAHLSGSEALANELLARIKRERSEAP